MPSIQDTAYPRLRSHLGARELADIYTPTQEEIELARSVTKGEVSRLGFLVLLKTFQRLGYAVVLTDVPPAIIEHVARLSSLSHLNIDLAGYDRSGTRRRHLQVIREHLGVKPYAAAALRSALQAMRDAAHTKDEPADLINVAIEELIRGRWELPSFNTGVSGDFLQNVTLRTSLTVHSLKSL